MFTERCFAKPNPYVRPSQNITSFSDVSFKQNKFNEKAVICDKILRLRIAVVNQVRLRFGF